MRQPRVLAVAGERQPEVEEAVVEGRVDVDPRPEEQPERLAGVVPGEGLVQPQGSVGEVPETEAKGDEAEREGHPESATREHAPAIMRQCGAIGLETGPPSVRFY